MEVIGHSYQSLKKPNPDIGTTDCSYKSLKKPNQDMGTADYMDPEKYTEPPVLPERNSTLNGDQEEDEGYTGLGTSQPKGAKMTTENLSESKSASNECVNNSSAAKDSVKSSTSYVDVDDPSFNTKSTQQRKSDHVDADDASLAKNSSAKNNSDSVDVDDPSLAKNSTTENNVDETKF